MIATDFLEWQKQLERCSIKESTNKYYGLQTIDPIYTSLYFNASKMGKIRHVEIEKFKKGDVFSLQGAECDDFTMPIKEYEVVKKVDEIFGIKLDGIVVKQLSGEKSNIFSLTKTDCKTLGIDFEPRLAFFPMNMNWKEVQIKEDNNVKEFVPFDFSTYPVAQGSGLIERIVLKISNVKILNLPHRFQIGSINNISLQNICDGIYLRPKTTIMTPNGIIDYPRVLSGKNITDSLFGLGCHVYMNAIYFEFNVLGIDPKLVQGKRFDELFDVIIYGEKISHCASDILPSLEKSDEILVKTQKFLGILDAYERNKQRQEGNYHQCQWQIREW